MNEPPTPLVEAYPASVATAGRIDPAAPTVGKLLRALRTFSLPVSVLPVFVAVAVALPPEQWDWTALLLSAAGAAMLHLSGNLLNDYFDFRSGCDRAVHDDAGRPGRLLVSGLLRPRMVLREALVCLALAAAAGAYLAWRAGAGVLAFQGAALVALYSYTGPPLALKYRALGEGLIFIVFGPLLMLGAAWAQTRRIEPQVLWVSIAAGLATTAILAGNNYRDREEDARAGFRTLGMLAGGRVSRALYTGLVIAATLLPAARALLGTAPRGLLAAPLTLILLRRPLAAMWRGRRLADIDAQTARFVAVLLVLFWVGYVLRH